MNVNTEHRDRNIDGIKGMAIILMVMGHCGFPFARLIYLFHMAVFFIGGGYCYKRNNASNASEFVRFMLRRLKSLWIPFVAVNIISTLLNNTLLDLNLYTDNLEILTISHDGFGIVHNYMNAKEIFIHCLKQILFFDSTQIGGATWFLRVLFFTSFLYCGIDFVLRKLPFSTFIIAQSSVSFILLGVGYSCSLKGTELHGLVQVLSCYWLYHGGFLMKHFGINEQKIRHPRILITATFAFLLVSCLFGRVELSSNELCNPVFYVAVSIAGWFLMYSISILINRYESAGSVINYLGRHTIPIMVLHFLCFKGVNFFVALAYNYPRYYMAAYPVLMWGGCWWIVYTVVGISIPLSLDWTVRKFRSLAVSILD